MSFLSTGPLGQVEKELTKQPLNTEQKKLQDSIEQKDWPGWKKQIYLTYLLWQVKNPGSKSVLDGKDPLKSWSRNARFRELLERQKEDAKTSVVLAGITIVVSATLVFFFINAILRKIYVINFSVDAIVAALAFAFLLRNLAIKYSVIRLYGSIKDYVMLDVASFLLALLLKLWLPSNVDMSLFIFMLSYFVQKRRLDTYLKKEIQV